MNMSKRYKTRKQHRPHSKREGIRIRVGDWRVKKYFLMPKDCQQRRSPEGKEKTERGDGGKRVRRKVVSQGRDLWSVVNGTARHATKPRKCGGP